MRKSKEAINALKIEVKMQIVGILNTPIQYNQ